MKLSLCIKTLFLIVLLFGHYPSHLFATESILAEKAKDSLLLDVQQLPNGRLVAVGERGHILVSDDQGVSWLQKQVPTQSNLTAVDFYNDNNGIAVGFEQVVLVTKDGGDTWSLVHQENSVEYPSLFDVEFVSSNKVIAVGAFGLYLESNDAGQTWQSREVEVLADFYGSFSHFYSLAHKEGTSTLYLAGEKYVANETDEGEEVSSGLVAVSNDGGENWIKIASPYDGSFFGVSIAPNKSLYIYGLKGNLYRSSDNGVTWQSINTNTNSGLHDLEFVNNDWIAVGTSGTLMGSSINLDQRDDLKGRAAVVKVNDGLIIVGEGGVEPLINLTELNKAKN